MTVESCGLAYSADLACSQCSRRSSQPCKPSLVHLDDIRGNEWTYVAMEYKEQQAILDGQPMHVKIE